MSVLDVISTPLREVRRLLALHALLDRLFQSTPLREGRQQMFPDFLRKFRNTSTNFVVLDEICGCEVPGFEGESTKMWCEGSGDFMTAWGSHVRLCGGDRYGLHDSSVPPSAFCYFLKNKSILATPTWDICVSSVWNRTYLCDGSALIITECLRVGLYLVWI